MYQKVRFWWNQWFQNGDLRSYRRTVLHCVGFGRGGVAYVVIPHVVAQSRNRDVKRGNSASDREEPLYWGKTVWTEP